MEGADGWSVSQRGELTEEEIYKIHVYLLREEEEDKVIHMGTERTNNGHLQSEKQDCL